MPFWKYLSFACWLGVLLVATRGALYNFKQDMQGCSTAFKEGVLRVLKASAGSAALLFMMSGGFKQVDGALLVIQFLVGCWWSMSPEWQNTWQEWMKIRRNDPDWIAAQPAHQTRLAGNVRLFAWLVPAIALFYWAVYQLLLRSS